MKVQGLDRITVDPKVLGGKPCIRGMRISVALIHNLLANGMAPEEILEAYPYLEPEDIRQALRYAALVGRRAGAGPARGMTLKFLADMGISPLTVQGLRDQGYDALHLHEEGLERLPDEEILEKAHREGRILLTHDLDFSLMRPWPG